MAIRPLGGSVSLSSGDVVNHKIWMNTSKQLGQCMLSSLIYNNPKLYHPCDFAMVSSGAFAWRPWFHWLLGSAVSNIISTLTHTALISLSHLQRRLLRGPMTLARTTYSCLVIGVVLQKVVNYAFLDCIWTYIGNNWKRTDARRKSLQACSYSTCRYSRGVPWDTTEV